MMNMKIIRGLGANDIQFSVLHNPQFVEMVNVINNALDANLRLVKKQEQCCSMSALGILKKI